jgi:hypothetical protein
MEGGHIKFRHAKSHAGGHIQCGRWQESLEPDNATVF